MLTFNSLLLMDLNLLVLSIILSNVYIIIHVVICSIMDTKQLCYL